MSELKEPKELKPLKDLTKLQFWFWMYNKTYFGGQLPDCAITWADLKEFGHQGVRYVKKRSQGAVELEPRYYIRIAKDSRRQESIWKMTLLHELVHLKLRDENVRHHGHKFQREMKRLANMGAFNGLW